MPDTCPYQLSYRSSGSGASKVNSSLNLILVVRHFLHGEGQIIFDVGPSEPDRYEQHLIYYIVRVYN